MLVEPKLLTLNQLRALGYRIERNNTHLLTVFACYDKDENFIGEFDTLPDTLEALNTHYMISQ
jgi:hypothetical protein